MLYKDIWISIIQFIDDKKTLYNLRIISKYMRIYVDNYATPTLKIKNMNQYHKIPFRKCKFIINYARKFNDKDINVIGNRLIELNLWRNNKITDNSLKTLTNLTKLNLVRNNIITDNGLKTLTNLTELNLSNNNTITNNGLKTLTNLTELDLTRNNMITNNGLNTLTNITSLYLWNNNIITNNGLKTLTNLTELKLWDNNTITDEYIYFLKSNNVKVYK